MQSEHATHSDQGKRSKDKRRMVSLDSVTATTSTAVIQTTLAQKKTLT